VRTFVAAIDYALYLYVIFILARVVVEATRQFARSWRPIGVAAVGLEFVYVVTDPPIKLFRRFVPPLQLGGMSFDLSILLLLLLIIMLRLVLSTYAV